MTSKKYKTIELVRSIELSSIQAIIYETFESNTGETIGRDCDDSLRDDCDICNSSVVYSCITNKLHGSKGSETFYERYGIHPESVNILNRIEQVINFDSYSGITYQFDPFEKEFSLEEAGRRAIADYFISSNLIKDDDFRKIALKTAYSIAAKRSYSITSEQRVIIEDFINNDKDIVSIEYWQIEDFINELIKSESPEAV